MSASNGLWLSSLLFAAAASLRAAEMLWAKKLASAKPIVITTVAGAVLAAAVALVFAGRWTPTAQALVAVVSAGTILLDRRTRYGRTGADQMVCIVGLVLLVAAMAPGPSLGPVALSFVAAQLMLCFVTAGCSKLTNSSWRDGTALQALACTYTYGGSLAVVARRSPLTLFKALAWMTICFELALPLVVFLDGPGLVAGIVAGLSFHLVTAIVMGLNEFPLAFAPAYPALAYVATAI